MGGLWVIIVERCLWWDSLYPFVGAVDDVLAFINSDTLLVQHRHYSLDLWWLIFFTLQLVQKHSRFHVICLHMQSLRTFCKTSMCLKVHVNLTLSDCHLKSKVKLAFELTTTLLQFAKQSTIFMEQSTTHLRMSVWIQIHSHLLLLVETKRQVPIVLPSSEKIHWKQLLTCSLTWIPLKVNEGGSSELNSLRCEEVISALL
jgi:hypothetical protein